MEPTADFSLLWALVAVAVFAVVLYRFGAAIFQAKLRLDARPRNPDAHRLPPGPFKVVIRKPPARLIAAVKLLRELTGWDLRNAKWALEREDVIAGISRDAAKQVVSLIHEAGGDADLVEAFDEAKASDVPALSARPAASSRCPYCHEEAGQDPSDLVACAACLARHHEGCWDEHKQCAGCGHTERFSKVEATEGREPRRSERGKERGSSA